MPLISNRGPLDIHLAASSYLESVVLAHSMPNGVDVEFLPIVFREVTGQ